MTLETLKAFLKENKIRADYNAYSLFKFKIPWVMEKKGQLEARHKTFSEKWSIHLSEYQNGTMVSDSVLFSNIQSGKKAKLLVDFLLTLQEKKPSWVCAECDTSHSEVSWADNGLDYTYSCKNCGDVIESNGKYYGK